MGSLEVFAIAIISAAGAIGARHAVRSWVGADEIDTPTSKRDAEAGQIKERAGNFLQQIGEIAWSKEPEGAIQARLQQAGFSMDASTWRGLHATSTAAGVLAAFCVPIFTGLEGAAALVASAVCVGIGAGIPLLCLYNGKKQRQKKITRALPSALELLNTAVRAGYPLERGIRLVGASTTGPLSEEFRRVDQEVNRLGMPLDQALVRMKSRCDTPAVSMFANAVIQSYAQGTSVSRALDAQAKAARNRYFADVLVEINQLPNKMIPVIFLVFFPIIIALSMVPVVYNAAIEFMSIM